VRVERLIVEDFRDAEIENFDVIRGVVRVEQDDVVGFDVAVDDAVSMTRVERGGRLADDAVDADGADRAFLNQHLPQAAPDEQLHDDVSRAVGVLAEIVNDHRVGVVEHRRRARLAVKTLARFFVFDHVGAQHFDRHGVSDMCAAGAVNLAHPAAAYALFQFIAPAEQASGLRADGGGYREGGVRVGRGVGVGRGGYLSLFSVEVWRRWCV
jgi:hypothetical protein